MSELKACPFCGGEAIHEPHNPPIYCGNCYASMPEGVCDNDMVALWNTRSSQSVLVGVGGLISSLRETDPYIETIYTQGGCYEFHLFLKSIFKDAKPFINGDKDHVASLIRGELWDITGKVTSSEVYIELEDLDLVESWSFAGNMILSIGECEYCEEPILVTPKSPTK